MKKILILQIGLTVIIVGLFSGCTSTSYYDDRADTMCFLIFLIIVVAVIIIIALIADSGRGTVFVQAPPSQIQVQKVYVKTCPYCGVENETDSQFCKHCGTKL